MVQIRFTKLIDKVMDHTKKQTIRLTTKRRRKYPLRKNQTLQVYLLFKLGDAQVAKVERKKFHELTERDAKLDGFENLEELTQALIEMHSIDIDDPNLVHIDFDVITFKPEWVCQCIGECNRIIRVWE